MGGIIFSHKLPPNQQKKVDLLNVQIQLNQTNNKYLLSIY